MNWFSFRKSSVQTKSEKIKSAIRKSTLGLISLAMAFSFLMPSFSKDVEKAKATGTPRFNFLEGDKELLRGVRLDDSTWTDPVNANLGDRVAVLVYFHNGMENTVARNTRIKVNLPTEFANPVFLTGSIDSDETSPITDTIVNGQVVGRSGLTINLPDGLQGKAVYIPGTTRIYRDGSQTGSPAPDGITTGSGLNIGDVNGCWPFAGFVSFIIQINGESNLKIEKRVAHPGDGIWFTEIEAMPGDEVIYRVGIQNDGGSTAENVVLTDDLPENLMLIPGTTYLYTKENPEGIKQADTIESGLTLPNIVPGYDGAIYITYKAKLNPNMSRDICNMALVNTAKVSVCGVVKGFAQAKIIVRCAPLEKHMTIEKKVRSGESWVEQNNAEIGDTIEYKITVRNTGEAKINNIFVRDALPVYTRYVAGSTRVNGQQANDLIVTGTGLPVGDLEPGCEIVITFCVIVYGCPPAGGYTLLNTGYARADGIVEIYDNATTMVEVSSPNFPVISNN